jgi:hypothetical protein
MQGIVQTLERNAREVMYGSVSVELRIHEGKVVKTVYRTARTTVTRNQDRGKNTEEAPDGGSEGG